MKQHKGKIIGLALVLGVLAAAYFWGGGYAGGDVLHRAGTPSGMAISKGFQSPDLLTGTAGLENHTKPPDDPGADNGPATTYRADNTQEADITENPAEGEKQEYPNLNRETGKDKYITDPVPEGKPLPVEPQDALLEDTAYTCILSVRCDTILNNMKRFDPEKAELVPEDGIVFPATEVIFYEGENAFNLLRREMKKNKIHAEFRNTPVYNSAYIRGINNLYEFDAGELSGWMYKINDWFPNYGFSRYLLQEGDVVEFVYTCDLGRDVGGDYTAQIEIRSD